MEPRTNSEALSESGFDDIAINILDDIILDEIFDVHWTVKTRPAGASMNELFGPDIKKFKNGGPGSPAPVSAVRPVNCPVCKLNVGAQRFAYHLQKCMGVGTRNSSKERRKKINQTQSTTNSSTQIELKPPRLESDLEYFRSNPVIVKIKVNDRGIPIPKQPRQIASKEAYSTSKNA